MATLSNRDGAMGGNTITPSSCRSRLAQWLRLLAQGKDFAIPKSNGEESIFNLVSDLLFEDEREKALFCLDLRLLILDESFPLVWTKEHLDILLAVCRKYAPLEAMKNVLLTLALEKDFGVFFYSPLKVFLANAHRVPLRPESWTAVLQLLLNGRKPADIARLTINQGLDGLPTGFLKSIQTFSYSQIRAFSYFLERCHAQNILAIAFFYICNSRFHHSFAFSFCHLVHDFIEKVLPIAEKRMKSFGCSFFQYPEIPGEEELKRSADLFNFWLIHSQEEMVQEIIRKEIVLPLPLNTAYALPATLSEFQERSFSVVLEYLPPNLLWNNSNLLMENIELSFHLALGNNIRSFKGLALLPSKKTAHVFHTYLLISTIRNSYYSMRDSVTWAYLKTIFKDAEDHLLNEINSYVYIYWFDQHIEEETRKDQFQQWDRILRKLASLPLFKELEMERTRHILGYFSHLIHEGLPLMLRGSTLASIQRHTQAWREALLRRMAVRPSKTAVKAIPNQWKGAPYKEFFLQTGEVSFLIVQLTTAEELFLEGKKMHHCVRSYQTDCVDGVCSIWSLRKQKKDRIRSLVTIEVNRKGYIVQAKGPCNRRPKKIERTLIKEWAKQEGLKFPKT